MLLSESPRLTSTHARILALAFCGWMFDFYDLILYTFLTRPISNELGLTRMDHSIALGLSFGATAVGGVVCGLLADRFGRRTVVSWTILLYSAGSILSGLAGGKHLLFAARAITPSAASRSLCSRMETSGLEILKCASNWPETRVSSAATRSTRCRISSARSVMSPRLPIGVATT